ncbi:hypothetical protein [Nonomuraea sp. NPDC048901]|uniref:hypothetical protein n=1 Tax=Nonomuraea sp. NPDC048901 TaxID=3155627 RepID=UPI0033CF22F8
MMIVLVALPTAVNLADDGLTWIWTRSLPGPLLHAIAWAGLLDAWLLLDLLAAVGVLGGAAVVAVAVRRPAVAATLLGLVAAVSLAAVPTGPEGCPPLWYGLAYAAALATLSRSRPRRDAAESRADPHPASVSTGRG